jgi:hypothetical protein
MVAAHGNRLPAELIHGDGGLVDRAGEVPGTLSLLDRPPGQVDRGARFAQAERDALPDPATRPGDQGDLPT